MDTGDVTMENYTKSLVSSLGRWGGAGRGECSWTKHSCEHGRPEDRRTTQLQRQGESRGEGQRSTRGQVMWGLENRIKSFRFYRKTSGQLSKDFKLMRDMRVSFNSVQPVLIRSTGR